MFETVGLVFAEHECACSIVKLNSVFNGHWSLVVRYFVYYFRTAFYFV
jgi:hypothetical protein